MYTKRVKRTPMLTRMAMSNERTSKFNRDNLIKLLVWACMCTHKWAIYVETFDLRLIPSRQRRNNAIATIPSGRSCSIFYRTSFCVHFSIRFQFIQQFFDDLVHFKCYAEIQERLSVWHSDDNIRNSLQFLRFNEVQSMGTGRKALCKMDVRLAMKSIYRLYTRYQRKTGGKLLLCNRLCAFKLEWTWSI